MCYNPIWTEKISSWPHFQGSMNQSYDCSLNTAISCLSDSQIDNRILDIEALPMEMLPFRGNKLTSSARCILLSFLALITKPPNKPTPCLSGPQTRKLF